MLSAYCTPGARSPSLARFPCSNTVPRVYVCVWVCVYIVVRVCNAYVCCVCVCLCSVYCDLCCPLPLPSFLFGLGGVAVALASMFGVAAAVAVWCGCLVWVFGVAVAVAIPVWCDCLLRLWLLLWL